MTRRRRGGLLRRLVWAVLCHWDIHDLPPGFRRIEAEDIEPGKPTWIVHCLWCPGRFVVQPEARLDNLVALARTRTP